VRLRYTVSVHGANASPAPPFVTVYDTEVDEPAPTIVLKRPAETAVRSGGGGGGVAYAVTP